jgi:protein-disulfide isomerase
MSVPNASSVQVPADKPESFFDKLTSTKGASVAIPAILALGGLIALGQNAGLIASPSRMEVAQETMQTLAEPQSINAAVASAMAKASQATVAKSSFSAEQQAEIGELVKAYLLNHPEVMVDVQAALEAKQEKEQAAKMQVAIKENAKELYQSPLAPFAGNAKGDVTVVEFFDYNCGYCKKALQDVAGLIDKDKDVKVVLKEFPILSKGSEEAARVALAARMQGKYWEFHRAMLDSSGQANEASALKVAEKSGLDMARLKKDVTSAEVKKELEDTRKLAQKMGIQGTPHFLVGDRVIPGAPDGLTELLLQNVAEIRKSGGCKVC